MHPLSMVILNPLTNPTRAYYQTNSTYAIISWPSWFKSKVPLKILIPGTWLHSEITYITHLDQLYIGYQTADSAFVTIPKPIAFNKADLCFG